MILLDMWNGGLTLAMIRSLINSERLDILALLYVRDKEAFRSIFPVDEVARYVLRASAGPKVICQAADFIEERYPGTIKAQIDAHLKRAA